MKNYILFFAIFLVACSQVTIGPKGYYKDKDKDIKHGFVMKKESNASTAMYYDNKKAKKGKFLYENYCFSCHGQNARGDGPNSSHSPRKPADIISMIHKTPNFAFFIHASKFKDEMPGWENVFTDEEMEQLESYLKFLATTNKD